MSTWTEEDLVGIGEADELAISPRRANGSDSRPTTIWVVRVGDDLFVRSWHGVSGAWYRRARATGRGRIRAGGVDREVRFAEADAGLRAAVDRAYRSKYGRYGEAYVGPMVSDDAAASTLQLIPG
ncbi:DUF2255 family protein [Georgenia ruanii]|uniref:DUF2255 family protein n=1 Tax=Georgenia ruanii TaxID=348442 RepID=A0A7J9UX06_9MICO|nr:DUF2255 family protein [Georgenia ruanii]MPV89159.1 DUF2255 family protein [Georgenia ruanii]